MEGRIPAGLSQAKGRRFGLTVGPAFLLAGFLLTNWRHQMVPGLIAWAGGGGLIFGALVAPGRLIPVERAWMRLALLISRVTTPIFMGVIYFLVITPVGLIMRISGHRPLTRRERDGSYWTVPSSGGRSDLTRQF
jgi:hypothetical protein